MAITQNPKETLLRFVDSLILSYGEYEDGVYNICLDYIPQHAQQEFVAELIRYEPTFECLTEVNRSDELALAMAAALKRDDANAFYQAAKTSALKYYAPQMEALLDNRLSDVEYLLDEQHRAS